MRLVKQFFQALLAPFKLLLTDPKKLVATPRKLLGLSLPARVAVLTFIFLLLCVLASYWDVRSKDGEIQDLFWSYLKWVILLVLVIPVITYQALRLWLEGEVSAFEDIDRAWRAGIAELERHGLDLSQIPIFLVIGTSGERQEKALFEASRLSLTVSQFPPGPAALHWFANPDCIYLVASQVGSLARLAFLGEQAQDDVVVAPAKGIAMSSGDIRGTTMPGQVSASVADLRQTMNPGATDSTIRSSTAGGGYRGTMILGGQDPSEMAGATLMSNPAPKKRLELTRDDQQVQPARLKHLCRLLRQSRQPYCPVNGILAVLPFGVVARGDSEALEVQKAARADLSMVGQTLKVRCHVTALVVGLENESGFRELVRRLGKDRTRAQRFGKGFNVWSSTSPEQMEALCAHACGAFEDFVYTLFREKDALTKPGNTKLFALLCKIRSTLKTRLDNVLVGGFANDPDKNQSLESALLGGCYFAACGDSEDRQAFVKSVFEKFPEQQEELQWLDSALRQDNFYRTLAYAGFAFNAILAIGLASLIYMRTKGGGGD